MNKLLIFLIIIFISKVGSAQNLQQLIKMAESAKSKNNKRAEINSYLKILKLDPNQFVYHTKTVDYFKNKNSVQSFSKLIKFYEMLLVKNPNSSVVKSFLFQAKYLQTQLLLKKEKDNNSILVQEIDNLKLNVDKSTYNDISTERKDRIETKPISSIRIFDAYKLKVGLGLSYSTFWTNIFTNLNTYSDIKGFDFFTNFKYSISNKLESDHVFNVTDIVKNANPSSNIAIDSNSIKTYIYGFEMGKEVKIDKYFKTVKSISFNPNFNVGFFIYMIKNNPKIADESDNTDKIEALDYPENLFGIFFSKPFKLKYGEINLKMDYFFEAFDKSSSIAFEFGYDYRF